jgi:transposase
METKPQKNLIVREAIRGEYPVREICWKYGIHQVLFYRWNKKFPESGKKRLPGNTTREATVD